MPTGYTSAVVDGSVTTLREFALMTARGMGALITMRDEPHDAPIPMRLEPSTAYHDERLALARARLAELEAMDEPARNAACDAYNADIEAQRQRVIAENDQTRNRYNAMLAQVVPWEGAPEGLKEFMVEQLMKGRDFDCDDEPAKYLPKPKSIPEWYREQLDKAAHDIGYHEEERAKEIARTAQRNAWLAKLHASLPPESP